MVISLDLGIALSGSGMFSMKVINVSLLFQHNWL